MRYFLVESKIQYQNYLYLHTSKNNAVHVAVHYPDQVKWICLCPANNAKLCFLSVFFPPSCLFYRSSCLRSLMPCLRGRWNLRNMWLIKGMMETTSMLLSGKQLCLWKVKHVSFQLLRNSREYLLQDSFRRKHAFCHCCLFLLSFHVPL